MADDYNPYEHRVVVRPTTNFETWIHILKGSLGTGLLAMPQAFKQSGYMIGTIGTCILGGICIYCITILIECQYILCRRHKVPIMPYPTSMTLAVSEGPRWLKCLKRPSAGIVNTFLILFQLGVCCAYVIFIAENLKQIVTHYSGYLMDIKIHMCIIFIPMLLLCMIRDLKMLAPFSTIANILTMVGVGICFYYILQDLPKLSERKMVGELKEIPLYFGTILFSLQAVGVFITVENNMKHPEKFRGLCGVFFLGMIFVVFLHIIVGLLGYWHYGKLCKGSITLNLPEEKNLAQSVRIIFAVVILMSYALQIYVPLDIIWNQNLKNKYGDSNKAIHYEYLIRVINVVITFLLAAAVPKLELVISLVGCFCLSALGFVFPGIIDICVHWPNDLGVCKWRLVKDVFITIVGITGFICGTYVAIHDIVKSA